MPRLTKIYTRTGDTGSTGLADGSRIAKQNARIQAIGDIDELNSVLGLLRAQTDITPPIDDMLQSIQHRLFDIGGELALPNQTLAQATWVTKLEHWLDGLNNNLPPLQEFILPGGSLAAAQCHQARSVCRRAERTLWQLATQETVNNLSLCYLNRLADLLFVIARTLARQNGQQEVTWEKNIA